MPVEWEGDRQRVRARARRRMVLWAIVSMCMVCTALYGKVLTHRQVCVYVCLRSSLRWCGIDSLWWQCFAKTLAPMYHCSIPMVPVCYLYYLVGVVVTRHRLFCGACRRCQTITKRLSAPAPAPPRYLGRFHITHCCVHTYNKCTHTQLT